MPDDPRHDAVGCELMVACPPGKTSPVFNLLYIVNEDGEIEEESMFAKEDGGVRQRRGCWVDGNKEKILIAEAIPFPLVNKIV